MYRMYKEILNPDFLQYVLKKMAEGLSLQMREVSHVCYFWSVKELFKLPCYTETIMYRFCRKSGIYGHLSVTIHFGIHLNIVISLTVCDVYERRKLLNGNTLCSTL